MKNQYIGDSKDYGKYRLLNTFVDAMGLTLGVNWYRTSDDNSNQGKTILKHCEDPLYLKIKQLISGEKLTLEDIERSGLLPVGTTFYGMEIRYQTQVSNKEHRLSWHENALIALSDKEVTFLDPDNGLPPKNYCDKAKNKIFKHDGFKYTRFEEIQGYWDKGQNIIVFQHAQHSGIDDRLRNLMDRYDDAYRNDDHFISPNRVILFKNKEISPINELAFLFFLHDKHLSKFDKLFVPLLLDVNKPWSAYFELGNFSPSTCETCD